MDYDDPGWRPALKYALPFAEIFLVGRRRTSTEPLVSMRGIFLSILEAMVLLLVPLAFFAGDAEPSDGLWFLAVIGGVAVWTFATLRWPESRLLRARSQGQLAAAYRALFFIDVGRVNAIALVGFVGVFVTGRPWMYVVGLALALAGFAMIAPARRNIERIQRAIDEAGLDLSLGRALTEPRST